jgi:hypothetical protein
MPETLNKDFFERCLTADFQVIQGSTMLCDLTLTQVIDHTKTPQQEAFSVYFHGPMEPFMQQGMYRLRHEETADLDIFLVPIAADHNGYQYEAVFNTWSNKPG